MGNIFDCSNLYSTSYFQFPLSRIWYYLDASKLHVCQVGRIIEYNSLFECSYKVSLKFCVFLV